MVAVNMLELQNCYIALDSPSNTYFAGQTVNGKVVLTIVDSPKKIQGLVIRVKGVAEVNWTVRRWSNRNRRIIRYHGRQDFMKFTTYLAGSANGSTIELPPGTHTYTFSCVLPPNLGTSVEADHGHIRYTLKVVMERPWKLNKSYKMPFTVMQPVDLNYERSAGLPIKVQNIKTIYCFPCGSSSVNMFVNIPVSGYVSGQTIPVKIDVDNRSMTDMDAISTKLVQLITLISQTPYKRLKIVPKVIVKTRCSGVCKRSKKSYEQYLLIPPTPPTSTVCDVLHVNYSIEVVGKFGGFLKKLRIRIPITLGTVAMTIPSFESMTAPVVQQPLASTSASAPLPDDFPVPSGVASTSSFPVDSSPPTYEEAMNANPINIQHGRQSNCIGWQLNASDTPLLALNHSYEK
ncbi:arrestin domain-containing protein 2-like [Topomyia yanbarensis]|uniref:arrestin domain-containing protein 2-like n=1 Tax=Topomyia yanbarensis TaxID=2498891 RepID=UPI00273BC710|nr:arrestin domain-containing protein 2-like [Topomyia yanbarensis]